MHDDHHNDHHHDHHHDHEHTHDREHTATGGRAARPGGSRRYTALGMTAGLLGGGAVGMLMTLPSFTSAATDDDITTQDAVVAPLQGTDETTDETGTSHARPEPGTRLRELLQELVDDGTLTAAQADAVTEHLLEHRPDRPDRGDRPGRGHRGPRPGFDGEVVAELLGIDVETLRAELRAGDSIADVAAEQGVDVQTVIDALVAEASDHLDVAVANERLTEDEAADRLAALTERITARVNGERRGDG